MRARFTRFISAQFRWVASGVAGKTSWEWLELLVIPLFLAVGAFYLDSRSEVRQDATADNRSKQETLTSYLEKMEKLLLDRKLRQSSEDSEVRSVARAVTTTTIKNLDSERNALLISFLKESNLVGQGVLQSEGSNVTDQSLFHPTGCGFCVNLMRIFDGRIQLSTRQGRRKYF